MTRRVISILALLIAWGCFALILQTLLDRENVRCQQFKDLATECFAPFGAVMGGVAILFVLSTLTLTVLALRPHSASDRN